jgi:hypothetical protein
MTSSSVRCRFQDEAGRCENRATALYSAGTVDETKIAGETQRTIVLPILCDDHAKLFPELKRLTQWSQGGVSSPIVL